MADVNRGIASGALDETYIRQKSLKRLDAELFFAKSTTPGQLPANMGSTLRWTMNEHITQPDAYSRFRSLTHASGNNELDYTSRTANARDWAPSTVDKKLNYYGEFVTQRKVDYAWMPKSVKNDLADSIGYAGAETQELLAMAQIDGRGATGSLWEPLQGAGTTNTEVAQWGGLNGTLLAADTLSAMDFYFMEGLMAAANVRPFEDGYYRAFVHPTAVAHLKTNTAADKASWMEINKHVAGDMGQSKLVRDAIGAIGSIMIHRCNNITTAVVDALNAYSNIVIGRDAVGGVDAGTMDPQVFINSSDASSIDDPYRMFMTTAYRLQAAYTMLREEACWLLYSYASTP